MIAVVKSLFSSYKLKKSPCLKNLNNYVMLVCCLPYSGDISRFEHYLHMPLSLNSCITKFAAALLPASHCCFFLFLKFIFIHFFFLSHNFVFSSYLPRHPPHLPKAVRHYQVVQEVYFTAVIIKLGGLTALPFLFYSFACLCSIPHF